MRLFKITKRVLDDESAALAQQVKNGNEEAWKKLKEVNNNYITAIAEHYKNEDSNLSDLIDSGNEGLKMAAKMFDNTRGFSFISYATWWIRTSILQTITEW
ncbi:MAG: hypothetical protein LBS25_09325 [Candidatus Symbiothrix sp.]|jgi:DNA-directed RNA polymerase sigma subunit (sigma70/sigma32)|nr:hypothetical protein [Candidatus Symbiothrix sp.]